MSWDPCDPRVQQFIRRACESAPGDLSGTYPNPVVVGLCGGTARAPAPASAYPLVECRFCGCDVAGKCCDHCGALRATARDARRANSPGVSR